MEFISERDFETTPARYAEYLRDTYSNAKRNLSLPEQKWPRGSSHDISRAIMAECDEAYGDLALEFGLFNADGHLAEFAQ